jgi:hypothetical protein
MLAIFGNISKIIERFKTDITIPNQRNTPVLKEAKAMIPAGHNTLT